MSLHTSHYLNREQLNWDLLIVILTESTSFESRWVNTKQKYTHLHTTIVLVSLSITYSNTITLWNTLKKMERTDKPSSVFRVFQNWMSVSWIILTWKLFLWSGTVYCNKLYFEIQCFCIKKQVLHINIDHLAFRWNFGGKINFWKNNILFLSGAKIIHHL